VIEPWSERWRNPVDLETLFVLHYTAQALTPFKPISVFKGLTERQATWACRLSNLFNLSSRRDILMLLWFSLQYSDLERDAESLGHDPNDIYTGDYDRSLMEWTNRLPPKYPEDTVPDEMTFAEWVAGYFTDVAEGRSPMWLLERRDDEA